jgi:hypothetical protein
LAHVISQAFISHTVFGAPGTFRFLGLIGVRLLFCRSVDGSRWSEPPETDLLLHGFGHSANQAGTQLRIGVMRGSQNPGFPARVASSSVSYLLTS